jgi:hypothetical protein
MKRAQEQKIETAIAAIKAVWFDESISFQQFNNRLGKVFAPNGGLAIRLTGIGPELQLPTRKAAAAGKS